MVIEAGIIPADRVDTWYQADLVVTCAPAERGARAIAEARFIVEVLSPLTAAHDRGVKLADYRKLASVEQILLVASEDRHVEVWRRAEDGWRVQDLIGDTAIPLAIDGQPLPLAVIYDGVALWRPASTTSPLAGAGCPARRGSRKSWWPGASRRECPSGDRCRPGGGP